MTQHPSKWARPSPTIRVGVLGLLAAFLLVLPLALAPRAEAFVYWTNPHYPNLDAIGRADLDGTGLNSRFIPISTANASPRDLALDAEHAYWAAACFSEPPMVPCTNGAIGRANLDGTGIEDSLIGGINPGGVAVDAEHVYWTWSDCAGGWGVGGSLCTSDELAGGPPGGIARAKLDGTGVELNFITGIDAGDVAVDSQHVYWTGKLCEQGCGGPIISGIGRANLDGSGVDRSFVSGLPTGFTGLTGLAVDPAHLYWTGQVYDFNPGPTLGRANLDGTDVDPTFIGGTTGLHSPFWTGVTVDNDHIYWTQYGALGEESIVRANLDGSGTERFIGAGGDKHFSPGAIAVDGLTVTKAEGKASAARTQRQTGKKIVVKVKVKAKEPLTSKARGKVKVNPIYKLKPEKVKLDAGETKMVRLKPGKKATRKLARALKRGEKATANLAVKLTDPAGNRATEKLRVRLKR